MLAVHVSGVNMDVQHLRAERGHALAAWASVSLSGGDPWVAEWSSRKANFKAWGLAVKTHV